MLRVPLSVAVAAVITALAAQAAPLQLQLSCSGAVLETRGSATLKRAIGRLNASLSLEAQGPSSQAALTQLQERLEVVRTRLKALAVQDLRVSSPSVWTRSGPAGKAVVVEASSQISGQLAPARLQELISTVGGLSGVRLAPVEAAADQAGDAASNRQLLQAAYRDALQRGRDLAAAIGLGTVRPLQVQLEGGVQPLALAMARRSPAPFDPQELPPPTDRLSLDVTFCATP